MVVKYVIVSRRRGFKNVNFYYPNLIMGFTYWSEYIAHSFETKEEAYAKLCELSMSCINGQFLSITTTDKMVQLIAVA